MADVPKNLSEQITKLQQQFSVPAEKLKEITDHFVKELEKGEHFTMAIFVTTDNHRSFCRRWIYRK